MEFATNRTPLLFLPLVLCAILCCVSWTLTLTAASVFIHEKSQQVNTNNLLLPLAEYDEMIMWLREPAGYDPNLHGEKAGMVEYSLQWAKE